MSLSSSAPWLKYYGNVPQHLSYPQKTIYQMVKAAAERNPKLPAYEFMGKKTTFTQFMQKIDETAQAFLAMGIKKGDRVTICMPNCPQALHAFYGLNRIGAVSNMIHPLSAAGEIKFYLNFSHSKCILTLDQFYAKIAPIMPELDDPDCKLLLAKIEDELYPHLALGYALTAARKYPKPPKRAITSGGRNSSASAKSATCPFRECSAKLMKARPSSIPAARPARPRAFSCPI